MLLKQRVKSCAALMLILLLMTKFLPGAFVEVWGYNGRAREKVVFTSADVVGAEALLLSNKNRRTAFSAISPDFRDKAAEHTILIGVPQNNSYYTPLFSDCRKGILQAISHYFHGSRYKSIHLAI